MSFLNKALAISTVFASISGSYAGLDLESKSNVVVYWGQDSFHGNGDLDQQPLAHYCEDSHIDVIVMAFIMQVNGPGGAPTYDLGPQSKECEMFEGTEMKNCPKVGEDIKTCQKKGKTIILSIGGATYTEGGFESEDAAKEGAELMWKTFGPAGSTHTRPHLASNGTKLTNSTDHANSTTHSPSNLHPAHRNSTDARMGASHGNSTVQRPFGDAAVDGFDFDFESATKNMAPFAQKLRELSDAESSKKYYLTAAPQCPYPDAADKDILQGAVSVDAIWVQFYNNACGLGAFQAGSDKQKNFNFNTWDKWAKETSKNKNAKVILGVPGGESGAGSGYLPADQLKEVIGYTKQFDSFGGVMVWDVTQAYGNKGFLDSVSSALGQASARFFKHMKMLRPIHW